MSGSRISLRLDYAMIDGRVECDPAMADTSGGHSHFTASCKTRVRGPASWVFDELDAPYDREKQIEHTVCELKKELEMDAKLGDRMLRALVSVILDRAKAHCDEHHQEYRKSPNPGRKGH